MIDWVFKLSASCYEIDGQYNESIRIYNSYCLLGTIQCYCAQLKINLYKF